MMPDTVPTSTRLESLGATASALTTSKLAIGPFAVPAAQGAIVLRATDVPGAVGKRHAVVELRHRVAMIEIGPRNGAAERRRAGPDRGARVERPIDASVVPHEHRLVGDAVI